MEVVKFDCEDKHFSGEKAEVVVGKIRNILNKEENKDEG